MLLGQFGPTVRIVAGGQDLDPVGILLVSQILPKHGNDLTLVEPCRSVHKMLLEKFADAVSSRAIQALAG